MIQFNLLPEVKQQYIKARRTKQLMILISAVVSIASLAILLLMILTVYVVQKKTLHDLNGDIATYSQQLRAVPNLDKILTVQNQLNTLTSLHDQKVVSSRLFTYIGQVTPNQASLNKLDIDYAQNTLTISGSAPSLDVVNTYTDTLKATTYKTDAAGSTAKHAFTSVVLSTFGRDTGGANFTITLNFDPIIFNSANTVTLTVPSTVSGSSAQLFKAGS